MKLRMTLLLLCVNAIAARAQTITLAPITKLAYCIGDSLAISYTATGSFDTGNVFIAELSDINGSFQTPSVTETNSASVGTFEVPLAASGPSYRVRVISIAPFDSSANNGQDIGVSNYPIPSAYLVIGTNRLPIGILDSTTGPAVMVGQLATFTASAFPTADSFFWNFNEDASMASESGTNVQVSYPTMGLKDGLLTTMDAAGCESTILFNFRVLDCDATLPWYATVVTGVASITDSFVWVKSGGIDTVPPTLYAQTIFVDSGGGVLTTSEENWNTYYIKAGGRLHPLPVRGTVVFSAGTRDTIAANAQVDTLSCDDLEFQVTSGVASEVPAPPAFQIAQSGDRLMIEYEQGAFAIRILNLLGAEVFSEHSSGNLEIDLSSLPSGIYFVVAESGDQRTIQKIAVIH